MPENGKSDSKRLPNSNGMAGKVAVVIVVLLAVIEIAVSITAFTVIAGKLAPVAAEAATRTLGTGMEAVFDEVDLSSLETRDSVACRWYRDHLAEDEVEFYDALDWAIRRVVPIVPVPDETLSDDACISRCFWAVIYDHPEYFWVDRSYVVSRPDNSMAAIRLVYFETDKEEIERKLAEYCAMADTVLAGAEYPKDEPQHMRVIYDWLCNSTTYGSNLRDQDLSGVFDRGECVCSGYTSALQFMALRAGIPCVRIGGRTIEEDGTVSDVEHTWLCAVVYGRMAYYDVTWDAGDQTRDNYALPQFEMESRHVFGSDTAPRSDICSGRDDAAEVVSSTWKIATGEHLDPSVCNWDSTM